jgi:hypothetical protein
MRSSGEDTNKSGYGSGMTPFPLLAPPGRQDSHCLLRTRPKLKGSIRVQLTVENFFKIYF